MPQIRQKDARTGITYVYDAVLYMDEEKKQSRYRRKLLGKIDPETGEIVPCGRPGRPKKAPAAPVDDGTDYRSLYEDALTQITLKDRKIDRLGERLGALESARHEDLKEIASLKRRLGKIAAMCALGPDDGDAEGADVSGVTGASCDAEEDTED